MNTITISLTRDQVSWVDNFVPKLGFANRSEFLRSVIRFLTTRKDLLAAVRTTPFITPVGQKKSEILEDFQKSEKYSPEFIKDLEKGLSRSSYFQ